MTGSRTIVLRTLLVLALTGLAVLSSWLIPRALTPPDRFAVAMELIDEGRADEAVYLLEDLDWRGAAEYRAGRFRRALYAWIQLQDAEALYNVGNAYARMHEWGGAKSAYLKALRLDPNHADARFNLELIEKAEAVEKQLEDGTRDTTHAGRWKDGQRKDDQEGSEDSSQIEQGGADKDPTSASEHTSDRSGTSGMAGRLGEKRQSDDPQSGASGGEADERATDGMEAGEGRAQLKRESTQAAEVLLREIRDDADRVLRARLMAAHRAREEAEGACKGC